MICQIILNKNYNILYKYYIILVKFKLNTIYILLFIIKSSYIIIILLYIYI